MDNGSRKSLELWTARNARRPLGGLKTKQGKGRAHSPQQRTSWVKKSHWKRNSVILGSVLLIIIVGAYSVSQSAAGSSAHTYQVPNSAWKSAPLTDANSGKNFTLGNFSGRVVVLQFMAVYCQYCLAEARQLVSVQQNFAGNGPASNQVVVVSVDVDPNQNLAQLQSYVRQNNFGAPSSSPPWFFAKDNTAQLLQSVVGSVAFSSFIAQANMYFIDKSQSNSFLSMQRASFQDASPASDIVAAAQKLF
jgi:thiol-disulfide isomerase/thioredoxin